MVRECRAQDGRNLAALPRLLAQGLGRFLRCKGFWPQSTWIQSRTTVKLRTQIKTASGLKEVDSTHEGRKASSREKDSGVDFPCPRAAAFLKKNSQSQVQVLIVWALLFEYSGSEPHSSMQICVLLWHCLRLAQSHKEQRKPSSGVSKATSSCPVGHFERGVGVGGSCWKEEWQAVGKASPAFSDSGAVSMGPRAQHEPPLAPRP